MWCRQGAKEVGACSVVRCGVLLYTDISHSFVHHKGHGAMCATVELAVQLTCVLYLYIVPQYQGAQSSSVEFHNIYVYL